jgi:hypothetical protein
MFCFTHRDDLFRNEPRNEQEVVALPADTEQEGDGVEGVPKDGLQREQRAVDVEVPAPPRQEPVDQPDERDDTQNRPDDGERDLDAQLRAVGKRVQRILRLVHGHRHLARAKRFLGFGVAQFRDGERGGDRHDATRHQDLGIETQADVSHQNGTADRGEATSHDLFQ